MDRRRALGAMSGLVAAPMISAPLLSTTSAATITALPQPGASFPRTMDFSIEPGATYLNAAYTHPIPRTSVEAVRVASDSRGLMRGAMAMPGSTNPAATPRALFAKLINAKAEEIAYVSSTSAGENLVVRALELDTRREGNVVTDGLHFEGALMHLDVLKRRGLDVRIARPTADGRILLRDLERLVDKNTRLVEITATAMYNGFQHDLKAVADLAHAHGALVYVDIVHAAGAEPLDVRANGIDFAACSSFKWLMGDFGFGFLYAAERTWDRLVRPVVSYNQAATIDQAVPPSWTSAEQAAVTYEFGRSAAAIFEAGSPVGSARVESALVARSLAYIDALGVARIQAHRIPLIRRLQQEMPRLGFAPITPPDATGGIVTFVREGLGASNIPKRLADARINVRVAASWMRISPSVYNDMRDIERLLDVLS
ncbi:MAG: aminotransferase class V-fold PLP-dependent enzyme [Gemmatimonadaceae bacterium]|nr:aminotransferase class V-fold PLP-dependent enzyme [Gemmatimonadaceae bacterium]